MKFPNIKISILMNCRNGEHYVKQAIDSVYAQTHQNFEIIFIDNHSTDSSAKLAQSYDERVRYFLTPTPMGLFDARNFGLVQCLGDYFCVLDADDFWVPNKLELQIDRIQNEPNVTFVYSSAFLLYEDKKLKTVIVNVLQSLRRLFKKTCYKNYSDLVSSYDINFQTIMIKMEYAKATSFNAKLNYIGDLDFHLRLIKKFNLKPLYLNIPLSTTRLHNMQVTVQTPGKWLREVKIVLINNILKNSNKEIALKFYKELARKRFVYFLNKKKKMKALKTIMPFMLQDPYLSLIVLKKLVLN